MNTIPMAKKYLYVALCKDIKQPTSLYRKYIICKIKN